MSHLAIHIKKRVERDLHVVCVVSNPARWQSRVRLARDFIARMRGTKNVTLHIVEGTYGERRGELGADLTLPLRSELWVKEAMINAGVRRLVPHEARYIAWVDADVDFRGDEWVDETIEQLQTFHVVQPWSHCADLGPKGEIFSLDYSFAYLHVERIKKQTKPDGSYAFGHSGYAWACTRLFWEQCSGLLDVACLGSGDRHMAWGIIGKVDVTIDARLSTGYRRACLDWQRKALVLTHGEVGVCRGRIEHHFHGAKSGRQYKSRWKLLVDHGYDPEADIARDENGIPFIHNKPAFEHAVIRYNRSRREDSI